MAEAGTSKSVNLRRSSGVRTVGNGPSAARASVGARARLAVIKVV